MTEREASGCREEGETGRRRQEAPERAAARADRLEKLLSVHPDFFFLFDTSHRVMWISPSLLRLWGKSDEQAVGKTFEELGYPLHLVRMHGEQVARAFAGELVRGESPYTSADNKAGYYEFIFAPVYDAEGEVEAVAGVTRDITERKRAEDRQRFLAEATAQLASSLDYQVTLQKVAELAVSAIADLCVVDVLQHDGSMTRHAVAAGPTVDDRVVEVLRRNHHQPPPRGRLGTVLERREGVLIREVSEEALEDWIAEPKKRAVLRGANLQSVLVVPLAVRERVVGVIRVAAARPGSRYDEGDLAFAEELARRAALAIDNAQLYAASQRAVRTRDDVLAVVSHDLRTPLGVIGIGAAALQRTEAFDERGRRIRKVAAAIQRAAERMSRLIHDLIDLGSIQAGTLSIERRAEDLEDILREAAADFEERARREGLRLAIDVGRDLPPVRCDRDRVLQVLSNLLANAVAVTDAGEVRLRAERCDHAVVLTVADTGPGIGAEELPHLFDRFWRKPGTSYKGAGLGLAIARGIVEAHGGSIWAESELGRGTAVQFTLPPAC